MTDKPNQLNDLRSIKPARDEVASYKRSKSRNSSRAPAKQSSFNGMLVFVIVLMAIMMGIGGYTLFEVQKKLDRSNVLLAKGQENVIELERRLNATGTDVSKTLVSIDQKLDANKSEIRKLWDVSNKRNKGRIADNEKTIKEIGGTIKKSAVSVDRMALQLKTMIGRFESLDQSVRKVQQDLLEESEEMITELMLVRGQVQDQVIEVKGAARKIEVLSGQQKNTEEAINAIDDHRRQLNIKISELQNQIRQLQQLSPEIAGS